MSRLARLRGKMYAGRAVALVGTLLLLAGAGPIARADSPATPVAGTPYELFAAANGKPYVQLDASTLADAPNAATPDLGGPYPNWILSADRSVFALLDQSTGEIVVRSGFEGPELRRIKPGANVYIQSISRDGTRLVTQGFMSCSPTGCTPPVWYVYDTTSGQLISNVRGDGQGYGGDAFLDPAGLRLYQPTFDRAGRAAGPWPLQIVAYDLTDPAGREAGRLTLGDVPAGIWYDRVVDQVPVQSTLMPAIALSPDGKTIAVVHADSDALTLIDAGSLSVVRTVALTRSSSRAQRLLGWLGLTPQTAEAKFMDGRTLSAVFSPDGRRLYVHGAKGTVGANEKDVSESGFGLRVIDVATGAIVAVALGDQELDTVIPAPDGQAVYAIGPTIPYAMATGQPPYRLVRLDPSSLDVLASRDFPDGMVVALIPQSS